MSAEFVVGRATPLKGGPLTEAERAVALDAVARATKPGAFRRHAVACECDFCWQARAASTVSAPPAPATVAAGDYTIGSTVWPGLSKLVEECGEVLQVAGKLMGSGGDTNHWSGELKQMFIDEIGDLLAAAAFFVDHNDLDRDAIAARRRAKMLQFEQWHRDNLGAAGEDESCS